MIYIISILTTAVLFILLILLLAVKPKLSQKITVSSLAFAGIFGFLIYGYGYMVINDNFILAVLQALLAVCSAFVGGNDYGSIASVPIMQTTWMQILCTFVRVCALYATASAIIKVIGKEALKQLRLWLSRHDHINVIYGLNSDTAEFGIELLQKKKGGVIFVSVQPDAALSASVTDAGCILLNDSHALSGDKRFLYTVGFGRKANSITLYAVDRDSSANIQYARKLLVSLQEKDAAPESLHLVILGQEELITHQLQVSPGKFGYGFVSVVNEPQMTARLLMRKYPPWDTVRFDETCCACENFHALLIGFGQIGQSVLKSLVMNSQFEGSNSHIAVFSQNRLSTDGGFHDRLSQLYDRYDITFYDCDARSRQMYGYLHTVGRNLKYVAVCTGNKKLDYEIAEELSTWLRGMDISLPIYQCSRSGISVYRPDGTSVAHKLYCAEVLDTNTLDSMAMILNQHYCKPTEKTPLENWMNCDSFSRQSSRASADFIPAVLRATGKTASQAASKNWDLSDTQLTNLSKTEHLRWCAFHYCMGFSPMSAEEYNRREQTYLAQAAQGKPTIRVGKNLKQRTHACLIGWDELDALSKRESELTGKRVDHKESDSKIILAIPELLQSVE